MTRAKRLDNLKQMAQSIMAEVEILVDEEAVYLYRLARKAARHQCSEELIMELNLEAESLRTSLKAAPEQCLNGDIQFKHAFRSVR